MSDHIFIGTLIEQELRARNITVTDFAQALGIQRPNAYRIFQQHSIDTDLLLRISLYLGYDFFHHYSSLFNNTFAKNNDRLKIP